MEEIRLDCESFNPDEIARLVNEMADRGTPMQHMQRRSGKSVPDGYIISAQVKDGKLFAGTSSVRDRARPHPTAPDPRRGNLPEAERPQRSGVPRSSGMSADLACSRSARNRRPPCSLDNRTSVPSPIRRTAVSTHGGICWRDARHAPSSSHGHAGPATRAFRRKINCRHDPSSILATGVKTISMLSPSPVSPRLASPRRESTAGSTGLVRRSGDLGLGKACRVPRSRYRTPRWPSPPNRYPVVSGVRTPRSSFFQASARLQISILLQDWCGRVRLRKSRLDQAAYGW